ncbi:MAG TPA: sodium:solute symporter [Candidatus Hydrogenedentes bacterium]|nr:sodium:solute symporter [Candidatus Hydrogenedentota bacterium]HRT21992.1 sodium:solute symporter [Candidatus Hydrogenedentota bacterium]HRT65318.1 sodium:solute symporter [Candidatus Hydrogenedentota bacterium]
MQTPFSTIDWIILIAYFVAVASIGPLFARRNKSTESFFVGNRQFPAWLLGLAMFATSISSITVVAFPGDAYKAAYLRWLPTLMLPFGILIGSKFFLPFYRRNKCTSAYEYLEGRFGNGVRTYVSVTFVIGQVMRIATILYLVSLVFQQMTGASPYACILMGGGVIAIYSVLGGVSAIVWAQFLQAFLLWFGAILCFATLIRGIDGGLGAVFTTGWADGKFMLGDLNIATGKLEPAKWFSIWDKSILMMLIGGLAGWVFEYSGNQNVVQKYVSAKNPKEAFKAIWICCACSVPTWAFFMLMGTSLYVFFKQHPDPTAAAILSGAHGAKPESILPFFCIKMLPAGLAGIVITGILAAAMSASSASISGISAVFITDIYRRHLVKKAGERHYVLVARITSAIACLLMMGGAVLFYRASDLTLQDFGARLGSVLGGGILGVYVLGFLTTRGTGRSVAVGIGATLVFSIYMAVIEFMKVTPEQFMSLLGCSRTAALWLLKPVHIYYVGLAGHLLTFVVAYLLSSLFEQKRDLTGLTFWTQIESEE